MVILRRLLLASLLFARPAAAAGLPGDSSTSLSLLAAACVGLALLAGWLGWQGLRLRQRLRALALRNGRLGAANAALRQTAARAEAKARLLDMVMASLSDGIAVVDADLRVQAWNPRFPELTGVPRAALRIGMPLDEVLRLQAEAGEFGLVDPEAEVARRMRMIREGRLLARSRRERPDGSRIELRRAPLPGGGFVTLYTMLTEPEAMPASLQQLLRAEWAAQLPRLTAAAANGDAPAVRASAHALRGVAANAGWIGAAAALATLEAAAEAGEVKDAPALAALLVADEPW